MVLELYLTGMRVLLCSCRCITSSYTHARTYSEHTYIHTCIHRSRLHISTNSKKYQILPPACGLTSYCHVFYCDILPTLVMHLVMCTE